MDSGTHYRQNLGRKGEELACAMLESDGHRILERNWRSSHLEIDIISLNADGIHFVEVKTRRKSIQAPPQDNVGTTKQRRTAKAAQAFLRSEKGRKFRNLECFFDVAAITFTGEEATAELIANAYIPIYL